MPSYDSKDEKDSYLRRYIERLKHWKEDNPPTQEELEALQREILLTQGEYATVSKLAQNHIERSRMALAARNYDQAIAELARASQLKPREPEPRIELAEAYLIYSREGVNRSHYRRQALKLIRATISLQPKNQMLQAFLKEHPELKIGIRQYRYRLVLLIAVLLFLIIAGVAWWNREWISRSLQGPIPITAISDKTINPNIDSSRFIEVNIEGLVEKGVNTEIILAEVGRRNESTYFHLKGRVSSPVHNLKTLTLLLRGRGDDSEILFSLPLVVIDQDDPPMQSGDTKALLAYHWLAESEEDIREVDLQAKEILHSSDESDDEPTEVELYWAMPRLEGMDLAAHIRNSQFIEAYDRQVIRLDLALTNTGVATIEALTIEISFDMNKFPHVYTPIDDILTPMSRGERRVFSVMLSAPLESQVSNSLLEVGIMSYRIK